jgi:undecaprenyl-diphosphatase
MLAATLLDLYKNTNAFTQDQFVFLGVGFVTSFIVAILAIKFLISFIKKHSFISFGVYRILIALLFWFIV